MAVGTQVIVVGCMAVGGIITGLVLVKLLRHPIPERHDLQLGESDGSR